MTPEEIVALVARYHRASSRRVHLVPSENTMSLAGRAPFLTDVLYRYTFTPADFDDNPAWPGNEDLYRIERGAKAGLGTLFGAAYVDIRSISGINCMTIALSALTRPGQTILSIGVPDGGHGLTRLIAERLGLTVQAIPYDPVAYAVDTVALRRMVDAVRPSLVYLDQFMCLFPHDLGAIRAAVGADTLIHFDGSHVMGLIAGGQFQHPLREGADSLGGSMHKTFPGPHKGVLLTNSPDLWKPLQEYANAFVSHHHTADVVSLAVAVAEQVRDASRYAAAVVANARTLGKALDERGIPVCAAARGYTASHQLWLDVARLLPPDEASRRLLDAGVVVNAIEVPYVETGFGLRLGLQEVTRQGMRERHMAALADVLHDVLVARRPVGTVRSRVDDLLAEFDTPERQAEEAMIRDVLALAAGDPTSAGQDR